MAYVDITWKYAKRNFAISERQCPLNDLILLSHVRILNDNAYWGAGDAIMQKTVTKADYNIRKLSVLTSLI